MSNIDKYSFWKEDFPAIDWEDVTPSDETDFTTTPRYIYVGGTGDVALVSHDDNVVTLSGVPAGTILPVQPKRINSTNTTATNLVALR